MIKYGLPAALLFAIVIALVVFYLNEEVSTEAAQVNLDPAYVVLQRKGPAKFEQMLKAEFDAKTLDELLKSESPSIVLAASWNQLKGKSLRSELPKFFDVARGELELDELPPWWTQTFRDGPAKVADNWYYNKDGRAIYHERLGIDEIDEDISFRRVRGEIEVVVDGKRLISLQQKSHPDGAAVLRSVDRYFLAIHNGFGGPFEIYLCDPSNDVVVWSATVWASGGKDLGVTSPHHYVEFVKNEHKIYVFGIFRNLVYVEVFNASTGAALIRFSTAYSDPRE